MSVIKEQVQFPKDSSLIIRKNQIPHFTFPYHYHKEYELVFVEKGYGTRYVGGHAESFADGDMVLLAPNLPHCWLSDKAYYKNNSNLQVNAIVVQMPNDFFNTVISSYPEFVNIKHLLEKSTQGIRIIGETRDKVACLLLDLFDTTGLERLFLFLKILQKIAQSKQYAIIANEASSPGQFQENSRMGKVLDFMNNGFESPIYLDDLCKLTGLTATGFCLWFKRNTGKTFSNFLHELRISKACDLLRQNSELKIADISFMVGFENLSNFNRVFKKNTGLRPKEYRGLFLVH